MLNCVVTTSIVIDAPLGRVFDFIADATHWPKWAIAPCNTVQALPEGCWLLDTLGGKSRLSIAAEPERHRVRYAIVMTDDAWRFDCQLQPVPDGTRLSLAFERPAHCDEACFEDYLQIAGHRLRHLKNLIEHPQGPVAGL